MTMPKIKGYFNFPDFYDFAVNHIKGNQKPIQICETGTYFGASAYYLGQITQGLGIWVDTVDNFKGSPEHQSKGKIPSYIEAVENLKEFKHVTVVPMDTIEWAEQCLELEEGYDFIFLDTNHSYDHVRAEIDAYLPLIRASGGIFGGHDYNDTWPGVKKAVDETFGDKVQTMGDCWYVLF